MIDRLLFDHPRAVGETYGAHARTALGFGWRMVAAGLACIIHALIPGLFADTASRTVARLALEMRDRKPRPAPAGGMESFAYVI